MRKVVAALSVLAAACVVAPAAATSTADSDRSSAARGQSFRQQVVALTNAERRAAGCRNLRQNSALNEAAQKHTRRMARANRMSHQLPGEANYIRRIERAGYRNWTDLAENVAKGSATPEAVLASWMDSPDHRANILNCRFKHIGVGYARSASGRAYWTQDFGRR